VVLSVLVVWHWWIAVGFGDCTLHT